MRDTFALHFNYKLIAGLSILYILWSAKYFYLLLQNYLNRLLMETPALQLTFAQTTAETSKIRYMSYGLEGLVVIRRPVSSLQEEFY